MPIVCKDVIIPFDIVADNGITVDEYNKKYGFNLRDFVNLVAGDIYIKPVLAKVYIANFSDGKITDLSLAKTVVFDGDTYLAVYQSNAYDENWTLTETHICVLKYTSLTDTIEFIEV